MASYWIYICTENPINRYAVSRNEYVDMQLEKKKKRRKKEHHNDNTSSSDNTSDESDK